MRAQGLDLEYLSLLELLYCDHVGVVGDYRFPIRKGVRQGDVLSPLLFNAVLEHALRQRRANLSKQGIALTACERDPRLTNIRYADNLFMSAQSRSEAVSMLESLADVLGQFGLELNAKKTKIMTTEPTPDEPTVWTTRYGDVIILGANEHHKYLGRDFSGDLWQRGRAAVVHRIGCAWMKYKCLQQVLRTGMFTLHFG